MRTIRVLLFVAAVSTAAFCSTDVLKAGVLEKVSTLQVDPTVVTNPEKVKDPAAAANLVRFTLRSAIREARFAGRQLARQNPHRSGRVLLIGRQSEMGVESWQQPKR